MYINIMHMLLDTCPFENIQKPMRAHVSREEGVLLSQDRNTWKVYHQKLKIYCWVQYQPSLKISSSSIHNKLCKVGQIQNHYFTDEKIILSFLSFMKHICYSFFCVLLFLTDSWDIVLYQRMVILHCAFIVLLQGSTELSNTLFFIDYYNIQEKYLFHYQTF